MSIWPRTLFGRVALIVCAGLALAHVLTFFIILRERGDLGLSMMQAYVGRDVAASVAILDRVPPAERAAWLPQLARQNYSYLLAPAPPHLLPPAGPSQALAAVVSRAVADALGASRVGSLQQAARVDGVALLYLSLRLADGTPLTLQLQPPRTMVSPTTIALLLAQLLALGTAAWLAVRLAVRPLAQLAQAADTLEPGQPTAAPPLALDGPREVAQAARAFKAMHERIAAHLAERMQLLAAISHDLQSPITRMKLRAGLLPDDALRDKLLADLQAMQSLVEEGLNYARTAHAAEEAPCAVDLQALLDGLVCDALDAGHQAELSGHYTQPLTTRVQALRRVLTNLIDNAVKFGGQAHVHVEAQGSEVLIRVTDNGPGIPEHELSAVFQPFYRVEISRNRETGGTGLGLAIAQQLTAVLGGSLELRNREEGGVEACLRMRG